MGREARIRASGAGASFDFHVRTENGSDYVDYRVESRDGAVTATERMPDASSKGGHHKQAYMIAGIMRQHGCRATVSGLSRLILAIAERKNSELTIAEPDDNPAEHDARQARSTVIIYVSPMFWRGLLSRHPTQEECFGYTFNATMYLSEHPINNRHSLYLMNLGEDSLTSVIVVVDKKVVDEQSGLHERSVASDAMRALWEISHASTEGETMAADDHVLSVDDIPEATYYVVAKDEFMSGWGLADGMDNWVIVPTNSKTTARELAAILNDRNEMVNVSVKTSRDRLHNIYNESPDPILWSVHAESAFR